MKHRQRFEIRSKEAEKRDAALRKKLTLTVLFSAVIIPLINDGVLYTLIEYTDNDIAMTALNAALRYAVVFLRFACTFVSFGAAGAGVFVYGYKNFKSAPLIVICGCCVRFLIAQFGSWVFCYEHGLINVELASDVVAVGFGYVFTATFDAVKTVVLLVLLCRMADGIRKGGSRYSLPDDGTEKPNGFLPSLRAVFSGGYPFRRAFVFAAAVQAVFEIVVNFVSVTMMQLATDGLPGNFSELLTLLPVYVLIIPLCAVGAVLSAMLCFRYCLAAPHKKL
ncbi:MAG: hypothetical protein J6330_12100 [Clostridia bacterium]|nr:hypothetical protein [Clostridia bacterium]